MAIQQKHSDTAGTEPNLIPGQMGVNLAEDVLWIRAAGKKEAISLSKWRDRAAPGANLQEGAPMAIIDGKAVWVPGMAPSSVVNDKILVDAPTPNSVYGIPGVQITGLGLDVEILANTFFAEEFYVASDSILIEKMAFRVAAAVAGQSRIGLARMDDSIITQSNLNSVNVGSVNTANVSATLTKGWYKAVFWSATVKSLTEIVGYKAEQGWNLDGNEDAVFTDRERASGNLSAGLDLSGASWAPETKLTAGIRRLLAFNWKYPT